MPPMPLQLLLILTTAGLLAIYGHSTPQSLVVISVALLAGSLAVVSRLAPDATAEATGDGVFNDARAERACQYTAYSLTLFISAVGLFLSLWWQAQAVGLLTLTALWALLWWPESIRTATVTTTVDIKREPAAVFAFVSDARNLLRYWPYYESVEMLTTEPVAAGSRFQARGRFPKGMFTKDTLGFEGIEEIVLFDPPGRLAMRADKPRPNLEEFTFEAIPVGTRLAQSFTFQASYASAVLAGEFFRRKASRSIVAARSTSWARAREILENGTA